MKFIKTNWLELSSLLISLMAAIFAYMAIQASDKAILYSTKTYLAIDVSPIPLNEEVRLMLKDGFGLKIDSSERREIVLFGKNDTISILSGFEVNNVGGHDARNVILEFNLTLTGDSLRGFPAICLKDNFALGDIPPDRGKTQDIFITWSHKTSSPGLGEKVQHLFEKGLISAEVSVKTSYVGIDSNRVFTGVFSGETHNNFHFSRRVEHNQEPIVLRNKLRVK